LALKRGRKWRDGRVTEPVGLGEANGRPFGPEEGNKVA
jgi:hypothetical protein